jgi:PAS domain S-box-containing protein
MTTATTFENVPTDRGSNSSPAGAARRILIVDDEEDIHKRYQKILRPSQAPGAGPEANGELSWELDFALEGREGLKLAQEAVAANRPYMVAFIDGNMPPGWDWLETTARIWEADPNMRVILCNGDEGCRFKEVAVTLGQSDRFVVLKKPVEELEVKQLARAFAEKWNLSLHIQESMPRVRESEQHHQLASGQGETCVIRRTDEPAYERDLLQSLMDNSPDYIYFKDVHSRFVRINRAHARHFHLRNPEEAIGKSDADFFSESEAQQKLVDEQCLMASGTPLLGKIEKIDWPDGEHWVSSTKVPIYGADGKVTGLVGISRDITASKKAEMERQMIELQLRQSQKLESIGQLAAGIAHEINTPTQYVGDNTRFLQDSFKELEPVLKSHEELIRAAKNNSLTPELVARAEQTLNACDLEYLFAQIPAAINETLEGVGRVTRIVRAMKEFSHPGGKEKSAADLNKAIESTTTVARNEWKYVADMKLDLAPDLPLVPCYLGEFNQVILNLIVNAAHAIGDVVKGQTNAKGLITVRTRREGDCVEIRVSDTGTGIPEKVRPHIFEPFFTTKSVGKGTGQGLSICYGSIVKKHGGTVTFETETGRGTTFILQLPIAPKA